MASLVRTPSQRGARTSSWPRSQTLHHYQPPVRLDYRRRNSPSLEVHSFQKFLLLDETQTNSEDIPAAYERTKTYILDHITRKNSKGKLLVITGATGSGKTCLLKGLLGEFPFGPGKIDQTLGCVSYASQEPWMFPGTIVENILFYLPLDEARYQRVVEVCALKADFEVLLDGDSTLVGDRGANLSGGQRARVNLARAIYKNAGTLYLMDDVLASVDVHVGNRIMQHCIKNYLKGKTRILVTHNPQYMQEADEIIFIKNGEVDFHGTYANLIESGSRLSELRPTESTVEDPPVVKNEDFAGTELELNFVEKKAELPRHAAESDGFLLKNKENKDCACWQYLSAGGSTFTLLCLGLSFVVAQVSVSGCDYWLAKWMTVSENVNAWGMESSLYLFGGLTLSSIVMWTGSSILFYKVCMNASRNLHNRMFSSLLKTSMRFFQLNSSGRILNRFSKDTGLVDETLPTITLDAVQGILMMIAVAIQLVISPWCLLIIPNILITVAAIRITISYLRIARNEKLFECRAKSTVYSHVHSTIAGLTTIRAACNRTQREIRKKFDILQIKHMTHSFWNIALSSGYGFCIDMLFIILLLKVTLYLLISSNRNGMEVLIITQILMLYGKIQFGLRQMAEMLVQMVSVERIFQFINLKSEGHLQREDTLIVKGWPCRGKIEFKNVYLKYSDDEDFVLKNINITINPQEKIGIVGRTGAGKTSLITALFRLADAEGSIFIDDIDINSVKIPILRTNISMIPQEPMLFTATVRYNLDPMKIYSDEILWKALEDVELKNRFEKLDYPIESAGNKLSTGEKQLLCLARAIVARNKIIVLDEATANVDLKTEQIIQKTIKRLFCNCTVITIAHRINNVFDNDRILVVDQGKVVEFDSPSNLLKNKDGYFFKMVIA